MSVQTWEQLINAYETSGESTGAALANTTTLTDISPGGAVSGSALVLPGTYLQPGMLLRFHANGIYSTTGTPTLLLGLYYGAVAGTPLAVTAATTTPSGAANNVWVLDATMRVLTTGSSGTVATIGTVIGISGTPSTPVLMPATSSTGGTATINTGTASLLTLGAQWGAASAADTITCYQWLVEALN